MKTFEARLDRNVNERRKEIAKRLKEARTARKLSQALVAEALGYSCQADIAKIEKGGGARGGRLLDVVELENFAQLYGLSMDHFETWSTQIAADLNSYGYHYDFAFRRDEFNQQLSAAKERRNRTRLLKLNTKRRVKEQGP